MTGTTGVTALSRGGTDDPTPTPAPAPAPGDATGEPTPEAATGGATPGAVTGTYSALPSERLVSWLVTAAVTLVAALLRFPHLSRPNALVFDETYYAQDAWGLLQHGVETTPEGGASFVVHPPLGKWLIAMGEWAFGFTETGWRVAAAVAGTLTVALVVRAGRRLTRSTALGAIAGLLLAFDGLSIVMSRTAMLDIFLTMWLVAAFALLLVDRDVMDRVARAPAAAVMSPPRRRIRWERLAAAVCLGLAVATKWSGAYVLVVLVVLSLVWDVQRRRRHDRRAVPVREIPVVAAVFGVVPVAVYLSSWAGWFAATPATAWGRDLGASASGLEALIPRSLRALAAYHEQMLHFHTTLNAQHAYQSEPWGWLLLRRPVAYYYESTAGCGDTCSAAVHGLGTPTLWWGFLATIPIVAVLGFLRRDWRAAAVLLPGVAVVAPWLLTPDRTMFLFYALPAVPFFVLTTMLAFAYARGPSPGTRRSRVAVGLGFAYVGLVFVTVVYFLPILTAQPIPYDEWYARMWFDSWI